MTEDMADVIDTLGTGLYELRRRAVTSRIDGRRVPPGITSSMIRCAIQPVSGLVTKRTSEGVTVDGKLVCWTKSPLQSAQTGEPDTLLVDGVEYQVEVVQDWTKSGGYFHAVLTRPGK